MRVLMTWTGTGRESRGRKEFAILGWETGERGIGTGTLEVQFRTCSISDTSKPREGTDWAGGQVSLRGPGGKA